MKILIDANVALDVLLERQPFCISGVKGKTTVNRRFECQARAATNDALNRLERMKEKMSR